MTLPDRADRASRTSLAGRLGRALVAVLLACTGLVLLAPAAQACTCEVPRIPEAARQADLVFTGTVLGQQREAQRVEIAFEVDRVYRGEVPSATVDVASPGDSCGLKLVEGQGYVVFARDGRTGLVSEECYGTTRSRPRTVAALERAMGPGERYREPRPEPPAPTYDRVLDEAPPEFTRTAAPGAAMALVGLLGWFLVRRRS